MNNGSQTRGADQSAGPLHEDDATLPRRISRPSLKKLESENSELLTRFYNVVKMCKQLIESESNVTSLQLSQAELAMTQAQINVSRSNEELVEYFSYNYLVSESLSQSELDDSLVKTTNKILEQLRMHKNDSNDGASIASSTRRIELEEQLRIAETKQAFKQKQDKLAQQITALNEEKSRLGSEEEVQIIQLKIAAEDAKERLSTGSQEDSSTKVLDWVNSSTNINVPVASDLGNKFPSSVFPGSSTFNNLIGNASSQKSTVSETVAEPPSLTYASPTSTINQPLRRTYPSSEAGARPKERQVTFDMKPELRRFEETVLQQHNEREPTSIQEPCHKANYSVRNQCRGDPDEEYVFNCKDDRFSRRENHESYFAPGFESNGQNRYYTFQNRDIPLNDNTHSSNATHRDTSHPSENYYRTRTNSPEYHRNSHPPQYRDYQWMDRSTLHFALLDLKRPPNNPYAGEPHLFQSWMKNLTMNMDKLNLPASDRIEILENHTTESALKVVQTFKTAFGYKPDLALSVILDKLRKRFGSSTEVACELKQRVLSFPEIRGKDGDSSVAFALRDLSDICTIINAQIADVDDLKEFNLSTGLEMIRKKLPNFINNQWRSKKADYVDIYGHHPEFHVFCKFLERKADILCMDIVPRHPIVRRNELDGKCRPKPVRVLHTDMDPATEDPEFASVGQSVVSLQTSLHTSDGCPLHQTNSHQLKECEHFRDMKFSTKKLIVGCCSLCFKCLGRHRIAECTETVECQICHRNNHITVMHASSKKYQRPSEHSSKLSNENGKEVTMQSSSSKDKTSLCTTCNNDNGKSCSKVVLVDVSLADDSRSYRVYSIIDEQSSNSFISPKLLDAFGIDSPRETYSITTMSGLQSKISGRTAKGLKVRGVHEKTTYKLPCLFENDFIPESKEEVATLEAIERNPSCKQYSRHFTTLDKEAEVLLLIGRDSGELMITEVKNKGFPIIHKTGVKCRVKTRAWIH